MNTFHSDNQFQPSYPQSLFQYLFMLCGNHDVAWDAATGNGKIAKQLATVFEKVHANDSDPEQLTLAVEQNNIDYFVAPAEKTSLSDESVDLITVGQALHLLPIESFFQEVDRVLKPGGILAVWAYNLPKINGQVDKVIHDFANVKLKDYWPQTYHLLNQQYQSIDFGLPQLSTPEFSIEETWTFERVLGYLNTWSAVRKYIDVESFNPINTVRQPLEFAWCDTHHSKKVKWPMFLFVGRKPE